MLQETPNPGDPLGAPTPARMRLAGYQTQLALDRTTLAWIRTTLTMASFGFGMVAFFRVSAQNAQEEKIARMHEGAVRFGVALIVLGLVATVFASATHWLTLRRLRRGQEPVLRPWSLSITVALLFAVMCLAGLWKLFES